MQITKRHLFAAAGLTAVALLLNHANNVSDTINGLQLSFAPGGSPRFVGLTTIEWPVTVIVTNPGLVTLPLQGVSMTLERFLPNGTTSLLAATDPAGVVAPPIAARTTTKFTVPVRASVLALVGEAISIFNQKGLGRYRLNPSIQEAGITIALQPVMLTY